MILFQLIVRDEVSECRQTRNNTCTISQLGMSSVAVSQLKRGDAIPVCVRRLKRSAQLGTHARTHCSRNTASRLLVCLCLQREVPGTPC